MAQSQSDKAAAKRREALNPKAAGEGGNGRGLTVVDNLTPEQREEMAGQAEEAQVLTIINRLKVSRGKEAEAKAKVDAAKLVHTETKNGTNKIFQEAKLIGNYQRDELESLYKAIHEKGIRKNQQAAEDRRARWRRYYQLPIADSAQKELEARLPETQKTAAEWESLGYLAGVNTESRKAPATAVKSGNDQDFLRGYDAGTARLAWGFTTEKTIPLPDAKPPEAQTENTEAV